MKLLNNLEMLSEIHILISRASGKYKLNTVLSTSLRMYANSVEMLLKEI